MAEDFGPYGEKCPTCGGSVAKACRCMCCGDKPGHGYWCANGHNWPKGTGRKQMDNDCSKNLPQRQMISVYMVNFPPNDPMEWKPWAQPTGWICPKCGKVYSPAMTQCLTCGMEEIVKPKPQAPSSPDTTDGKP